MSQTDEYRKAEQPLMNQLDMMGWAVLKGDTDVPYVSAEGERLDRESFDEVLLRDQVRDALRRINRRDGEPWLGESRIEKALHDLERVATPNRTEANQKAMCLLRKGKVVGDPELPSRSRHSVLKRHRLNSEYSVQIEILRVRTLSRSLRDIDHLTRGSDGPLQVATLLLTR